MTCAVVVLPLVPVTPMTRTLADGASKNQSAIAPSHAVSLGMAMSGTS